MSKDDRRQRRRSDREAGDYSPAKDQFYEEILDDEEFWEEELQERAPERSETRRREDQRRRRPEQRTRTRSSEQSRRRSERRPDPEARRNRSTEVHRSTEERRGERRRSDEVRRPEDRRRREPERARRREENRDSKPKKKGGCLGCLIPVIVLIAVLVGIGYLLLGSIWGRVIDGGVDPSDVAVNADLPASVKETTKNYRTIMLYGVDSRDQDPTRAGALADSNILVTINKKTGEICLTSIYRDTYVETTDGSHMKLTEVYSRYGAKESMQTINKNFDLNVSEFVTVTWEAVATAIDGLGGLDLNITRKEAENINKYLHDILENTDIRSDPVTENISENGEVVHLNGAQAVTYCRLRKGLGDDYKRTERQRTVINAAFQKAKKNPVAAVIAANKAMPMIASNMDTKDLMGLCTGIAKYNMGESEGFPYDHGDGKFVYPNTTRSNAEKLHQKVYGDTSYEASETVWAISRSVAEYSGYWGN